jgi:predicted DNA-binding transcriptional regulator AlpA
MKSHKFPAHDRAVREPERLSITGVPTSTWYELQAEGRAPRPFPIGNRIVGWSFNELSEWVSTQKSKRSETWHSIAEIGKSTL